MLQRAASNAYSWWWASHIRTKQSKWLEQSLLDMEEKVASTLKIIDHDGDSFAKRAEMYYRKRPELIEFVEESYKAYRALAERYDHLSRELQSANRKIATAFPEEVPFEVDDEDFDEQLLTGTKPENRQQKELPDGSKARIPKVPAGPGKEFRSTSRLMSRKGTLRKTPSYAKPVATAAIPTSGLTKEEATAEIDKLQKDILSFQTEKEFVKSSYERGRERYWEIENHIMDMQKKVCDLQDEFEIGIVIEDNEARKLMAMTALKSCQTSLAKLQERHERSEVEVKIEEEKIDQAIEKFEEIRGVSVPRQREDEDEEKEDEEKETSMKMEAEPEVETEKVAQKEDAIDNLESAWEKMKEEIDAKLSVPELAEKIDNLVDKVVNLEIEVSRQAAQVRRLRSETAALQALILNLEEEHKTVVSSKIEVGSPEDSKMNNKLKEFEEDLIRVKNLKQQVLEQCRGLLSQFNEASSNLNQLSEKLETVKLDDDVEMTGLFREAKAVPPKIDGKQEAEIIEDGEKDDSVTSELKSADAKDDDDDNPSHRGPARSTADEESLMQSGPSSDFDASSEKPHEHTLHHDKDESLEELAESTADTDAHDLLDDQPNWRQLFLNGLEDREKVLLEEYTSILRSYKDVKSKLSEAEKKNRDGLFEMAMQIRELRNENSQREEEIKSLRQKLGISGDNGYQENHKEPRSRDSNLPSSASKPSTTTTSSGKQPLYKLLLLQNDILSRNQRSHSATDGEIQVHHIAGAPDVLSMEEKFRSEIDDLLEENMEFWLRFSTSIHQIQKFQTTFHDLQAELSRLKINKKQQEGIASSVASEARPIYKHLREIQTEIKFWLEHHTLLNEELQNRHSVLGNIQDGISRVLEGGSRQGEAGLTEYQAAKLQGEVLNMRQESKKVSEELRAGQERVRKLQAEIERTLSRLDEVLGISTSKSHSSRSRSSSKSRIPLRSFLFGVKLKKQKPSIFSCMSPALQKQGSELGTRYVNLD